MTETSEFAWVPFYTELADKLLPFQTKQAELIAFLSELREQGRKVPPLEDQDADGNKFPLEELDPFTFFGSFNRGTTLEERRQILQQVKPRFGISAPVPTVFDGVPMLNNLKSWFFPHRSKRRPDDIARLWRAFELALGDHPLESEEFGEAFDAALTVRNTNINLTMGLFWIRPSIFIALDNNMRTYLHATLPSGGLSFRFYRDQVASAAERYPSFPSLSHQAWLERDQIAAVPHPLQTPLAEGKDVWLMGAYWEDDDPPDQTPRFIEEGIWENGYEDRYLDQVGSIKAGDIVAIKSTSTQKHELPFDALGNTVSKMTIKARGTVVANPGDGLTVEVEWDPDFKRRDWYFYTYQPAVWRMKQENEYAQRLVAFITNNQPQDYEWFVKRWYGDEKQEVKPAEIAASPPYSIDQMLDEGVFLERTEIEQLLQRLSAKKNLILQGAPGVGKTFVARKLAFLLMEAEDNDRLQMVQFHQSYSYEDFVRGFRPAQAEMAGAFDLVDGPFLRFCRLAADDPDRAYVFVIDEINRGNLSQIFGELLMLIEADKRHRQYAVPLMYPRKDEPRFHVPPNVHILGMMNIADRSLAMVDYALRRRFAFFTLEPKYEHPRFEQWLLSRSMRPDLVALIRDRLSALNRQVSEDRTLGPSFQLGHSYFCPRGNDFSRLDRTWYDSIVRSEIGPLLDEYWFDAKTTAQQATDALLVP